MLNRSASLAMSTSILKALPGKIDIKRHSPSILYLHALSVRTESKFSKIFIFSMMNWLSTLMKHSYDTETNFWYKRNAIAKLKVIIASGLVPQALEIMENLENR